MNTRNLAQSRRMATLYLVLIILLLAGLTPLALAAPGDSTRGEPMRVVYGFDREFPPFSYEDAGGTAVGFEIELVKAIFNDTNVTIVPRPLNWDMVPLELSAGTINLTSGMIKTEQRSRLYLFSAQPSFLLQIRLFTKIYNRVPSTGYLRGQPVAVEQGSYQHRLLEFFGGINIKPYKERVGGLRALYNDEVIAYCGLMQNTYYYINKLKYGAITTVGTPLGAAEMRFAVNRDRGDIQRMVDEGLAKLIQNGEYNRLYRKWFVRELNAQEQATLLQSAGQASVTSYVPYSTKPQGAAILTATGKVYAAAAVENADPGLSISALRAAIVRTVADGEYELRAAVVVNPDGSVARLQADDLQALYEFGQGILVIGEQQKGVYETAMMADLLPKPVVRYAPPLNID